MQVDLIGIKHDNKCIRHHPYAGSESDPRVRYYDFVSNPELVRTVLEDFKPYEHHDGVQKFYELIEWINRTGGMFSTSDCRLESPQSNTQWPKMPLDLVLKGRLMVLFRNLLYNLSDPIDPSEVGYPPNRNIERLGQHSKALLAAIAPMHWATHVGIYYFAAFFEDLDREKYSSYGYQVVYEFTTFGDSEQDLFVNLGFFAEVLRINFTKAQEAIQQ